MRIPTLAAVFATAALTLPATAQSAAHMHIGHVADGWRDTPDGMGLLPTAQAEAEIALRHAGLATQAGALAGIKAHAGHVLNALDIEAAESGPGKGYGMLRAARGAARHMELAAGADDASDNVKRHAEHVSASLANVIEWGEVAREKAMAIQETDDQDAAAALAVEMETALEHVVSGYDANGDGRIGWGPGEGGLAQAATHLGLLKRGEGMGS